MQYQRYFESYLSGIYSYYNKRLKMDMTGTENASDFREAQINNIREALGLSTPVYASLILVNTLIILIGLIGNGTVMYAFVRHRAIKLDNVSRFLLEILTISDIVIIIVYFFPMLLTLCANRWALGPGLCYVTALTAEAPFYFQIMIKTTISIYRLWVCRQKVRINVNASVTKFKVTVLVFVLVAFLPLVTFFLLKCKAEFVPQILRCLSSQYRRSKGNKAFLVTFLMTVIFIAIPIFVIVGTNAWTLSIVERSNRNVSRNSSKMLGKQNSEKFSEQEAPVQKAPAEKALADKAPVEKAPVEKTPVRESSCKAFFFRQKRRKINKTTLMLSLVCCSFVLCYVPTMVKFILYRVDTEHETSQFLHLFHNYMLSINSIVNPFIYIATSRYFRLKIREICSCHLG